MLMQSYNLTLQVPGQDIVPVDSSSSSQQDELSSLGGQVEAEGMDVQHSEASQSSATDPQSSELERNDGSTSSLSLSSERLEEGGIVAIPPSDGSLTASRRTEAIAASAPLLGSRTISILSSSSGTNSSSSTQHQQTAAFLQSLGSELSSLAAFEQASSPHLESSVDPSSSQLSLDSSNGSSSQGDVSLSQSEIEAEEGLRFTARTRTSSDSNLPSQAGLSVERTPPSASRSSSSIGGTSVIVEPSNSRGTSSSASSSSRERSGGAGEGQQRPSRPPPPDDDDGAGNSSSSRSTGQLL